jgi:hypothetical protein
MRKSLTMSVSTTLLEMRRERARSDDILIRNPELSPLELSSGRGGYRVRENPAGVIFKAR